MDDKDDNGTDSSMSDDAGAAAPAAAPLLHLPFLLLLFLFSLPLVVVF